MSTNLAKEKSTVGDSIQVFVRVRPPATNLDANVCLTVTSPTTVLLRSAPTPKEFTFDHVADEGTTQETVFASVGRKIIEGCIEGYNGTIFAYGQTGSGKTFTMLGPSEDYSTNFPRELRGVIPRSLDYLFQLIERKTEMHGDRMHFLCKCSFLEIYNEQIFDLLDPASTSPLQMRESLKRGVFVDGCIENQASTAMEAYATLMQGWNNRHVAATSMNRESSRSHAVFTVAIESKDDTGDITKVRESVLNLVDLAGSERQRDTSTSGLRLREAGNINKSLSVLGNVIMSLVDVGNGKPRHVPYRNSKLTFLLRDSVGGNARTYIIANVHPSSSCFGETLSTLYFTQRAKMIRNKARVNEDAHGDVGALQIEIKRLKLQLARAQTNSDGITELAAPGDDYQQRFYQAMELLKQQTAEVEDIATKLAASQDVINKTKKALLSARMVIKFRDSTIQRMRPDSKQTSEIPNEAEELLKKEIGVLKEQLANHPEVAALAHKVEELKRTVERLQSSPALKDHLQTSRVQKAELYREFRQLMDEQKQSTEPLVHLSPQRSNESSEKLARVEAELESARKQHQSEIEKTSSRIAELQAEIAGAKQERVELEKMLQASQEGARAQIKHMNSVHNSAIRAITTPQKKERDSKRSAPSSDPPSAKKAKTSTESSDSILNALDNSWNVGEARSLGDFDDVDDDLCAIALRVELESERECKAEMEERMRELDKECRLLKQQLATVNGKYSKVQDIMTALRHDSVSQQETLRTSLNNKEATLSNLKQENELKSDEIRDLRIMINSADRQLVEKKNELIKLRDDTQKEISALDATRGRLQEECSLQSAEAERLRQRVQELETELMTSSAEAEFCREQNTARESKLRECEESLLQLQSQIDQAEEDLAHSRKLLEGSNREKQEVCDELRHENDSLRSQVALCESENVTQKQRVTSLEARVETAEKIAKNDKVAMQALLRQVNECRGTISMQEIVTDQLRSEAKERQDEIDLISQEMEKCTEQKERYYRELVGLHEQVKEAAAKHQFEVDNIQDDLSSLTEHYARLEAELQQKDEKMREEREGAEVMTKSLQAELDAAKKSRDDMRRQLDTAVANQENLDLRDKQLLRLDKDLQERVEQFKQLQVNFDHVMEQYRSSRDRISHLEAQVASKQQFAEQLQKDHTNFVERVMVEKDEREVAISKSVMEATSSLKEALTEAKKGEEGARCESQQLLLRMETVTEELTNLKRSNEGLNEDVSRLTKLESRHFDELQEVRSQLEEEQALKAALTEKLEVISSEKEKLAEEAANLAGHTNHHQKIHYLKKLRNDHVALQNERNALASKCERQAEIIRGFERQGLHVPVVRKAKSPLKDQSLP